MPRRAKDIRLWLRPARRDRKGNITHQPTWFIRDGDRQISSGLRIGAGKQEREAALTKYLTKKHVDNVVAIDTRDPRFILIDDVVTKYTTDIVAKHARPEEAKSRLRRILKFWGGKQLSEVTGDTCDEYARQRSTPAAARRELEDLRSAINHHRARGLHDKIVSVTMPERSEARERWLTRDEAAALIWAAWRYREVQNLRGTDRRTRRHVARFMVVARYMGSRASVICGASIEPKRPAGQPWINLTTGMFYGRPEGQRETNKRRQQVRIPPPLLAHLRRWRRNGQRFAVEWNGEPVQRVTKAHNAVVKAAGLGAEVTPHIWRHTVATWLMQAEADPFKAAGFLAMSVETLLRVYGHHHPDHSAGVHAAFHRHRNATDISEQKGIGAGGSVPKSPVKSASAR